MATVYFGTGYDFEVSRKCVGSLEEMLKLVQSWCDDGFSVIELKNNVWFIEL